MANLQQAATSTTLTFTNRERLAVLITTTLGVIGVGWSAVGLVRDGISARELVGFIGQTLIYLALLIGILQRRGWAVTLVRFFAFCTVAQIIVSPNYPTTARFLTTLVFLACVVTLLWSLKGFRTVRGT